MLLSLLLNAPLSPSSINVLPSPSCLLNNRASGDARSFIKTFWSKVPKLLPETPNLASSLIEASGYSTRTISPDRSIVPEQSHGTDLLRIAAEILGDPRNLCNSYVGISALPTPKYYYISLHITHTPMPHMKHNAPYTPCPISHSTTTPY